MGINLCRECLKKQQRIDDLLEENQRLKQKPKYQERKEKEGFFGSATSSAKVPVKANTPKPEAGKRKGAQRGHKGAGRKAFPKGEADPVVTVEKFGGIKYDEGSIPLNIGGAWETKDFTITMVNAVHTSDIMGEDYKKEGILTPGSGSVGYVMEFKGGPSIYYGGDTGVFGDMAIIRDLYSPDVAILPVGGKYNMGCREAGYAAFLLQPKFFLPIHFDTFPNQKLDFPKLVAEVKVRAPYATVVDWKPCGVFEYK